MERKIPDFAGTWKMKSSENFEELLKALGVNVMLRKIAVAAASKPSVEITQEGETLSIRTFTSVRTTHVTFTVGESFNEATVDGRPCTSLPKWETDSKISCEQTLQKGEGPKTAWTREITNDGELILFYHWNVIQNVATVCFRTMRVPPSDRTMSADDVVCTRVYVRE
ncbi:cellular retinoic acid-binding protein 2-like isoform X1 [Oncorhynchus nerka]|uniref:cellular retinoic acid-binding protein 2-like isoform X1 n=1 Tax=Oncorhynchus nerka TaxID=8023 RepID=UPI0031B87F21